MSPQKRDSSRENHHRRECRNDDDAKQSNDRYCNNQGEFLFDNHKDASSSTNNNNNKEEGRIALQSWLDLPSDDSVMDGDNVDDDNNKNWDDDEDDDRSSGNSDQGDDYYGHGDGYDYAHNDDDDWSSSDSDDGGHEDDNNERRRIVKDGDITVGEALRVTRETGSKSLARRQGRRRGDDSFGGEGDKQSESEEGGIGLDSSSLTLTKGERRSWALRVASERLSRLRSGDDGGECHREEQDEDEQPLVGKGVMDKTETSAKKKDTRTTATTTTMKNKKSRSKHAPAEVSSRRSDFIKRLSNASSLGSSGVASDAISTHRYKPRDPRKSDLSGHFNPNKFERDYYFLEDIQDDEIRTLKERISARKKKGRAGKRARKRLGIMTSAYSLQEDEANLTRLTSERAERRRSRLDRAARRALKDKIIAEVSRGERAPYYLKKRERKRLELEEKFEQIRKTGGDGAVDKAMAKRRKKNAAKDRKRLPPRDGFA